jgi:hypothetical protein
MRRLALGLSVSSAACWSEEIGLDAGSAAEGAAEGTSAGATSATSAMTMSGTGSTETASSSTTTTTTTTSETETVDDSASTCSFLFDCYDNGGDWAFECDPFGQDCRVGEKCVPWANDGGDSWNATKCVPIDRDPVGLGEACTVVGSWQSGIDDCAAGSMCWDVDDVTQMGYCVSFCTGTAADPMCEDEALSCLYANGGVIAACVPVCNPLSQDCLEGQGCYPFDVRFLCMPDASDVAGAFGDPCDSYNDCDIGLFCAYPTAVPACQGARGCCSEFCDLALMNDAQCAGFANGQACVSWYGETEVPMGYENVGACLVPP